MYAVDDMVEGKAFYELQKEGLGDYFWDCILSDIESFLIYGVVQVFAILPVRADPVTIATKMQSRH